MDILSGGKAKINLHKTPKLIVIMQINCLLRSIHFPSPQLMRSPLAPVLVNLQLRGMFSVEPFIFLNVVTSTYARHSLNPQMLLARNTVFRKTKLL